jgi:predicted membrane-bound dolichyl-phosphate-mannose-protein mannosyltransferase
MPHGRSQVGRRYTPLHPRHPLEVGSEVTSPQADGADRISRVKKSPLSASAAFSGLGILLLVGLLLRLAIAYILLPRSGFESDIGTFAAWASNLAEGGAGSFYATAGFADYPPGYLYVLWLIGGIGHLLAPMANGDAAAATAAIIKLPAILADVAVGFVLYRVVRSWRAPRLDAHRVGLIAAALYLFNPVTWYDSAIWGQTDAFGALVILLGVAALVRGNSEGATALAVLAALIKPQFGIVLLPIVGIVLVRRHLFRPNSAQRNRVLVPNFAREWFESEQGAWRLVSSAVVGLVVLMVVITPFSLDVPGFLDQMQKTAGGYPYLSVNAYNPWALVGAGGRQPLAFGGGWSADTVPLLGPLPGVAIGGALLALGFVAGIARVFWRDDRRTIVIATIFLSLCFFMLPTRVHERYMFPIFGLLPLLAAVDRRWLWATVGLSVAAFINFHGILTTDLYATPNLEHLPLGDFFRQPLGIMASVLLHFGGFAFVIWQLRPGASEERDPYAVTGRARGALVSVPRTAAIPAATATAPAVAAAALARPGAVATSLAASSEPVPASGDEEASAAEATAATELVATDPIPADEQLVFDDEPPPPPMFAGVRSSLARLIGVPSVRRDRSALLFGEGGGSLGRRDLALVALIFISTLLLRSYRLEVPYGMHFDEVYHARTAMEFLQDWRYDMPHSIYEYTHPHMAKYLMALGIVALGNNRVTDVRELGAPVRAAEIEQRWSEPGDPNGRNGDRLYVVTDAEVRAYDLASRAQVATIPGSYTAVAVDPDSHSLYLADTAGAISMVATAQLDELRAANQGVAQITADPFAQVAGLTGQLSSVTVASKHLVAIIGDGTMVSLDLSTGSETGRNFYTSPTAVAETPERSQVIVDPGAVTDAVALSESLAGVIDRDPFALQTTIERATSPVAVAGLLSKTEVTELNKMIDDGELPGVKVENETGIAVGLATGIVVLDGATLNELAFFGTLSAVSDLTLVEQGPEQPSIYATTGDGLVTLVLPLDDAARIDHTVEMPGPVEQVFWNRATTMVHVLGRTQDGTAPTVYVVEPRADGGSVFADARLDTEPQAIVLDVQRDRPAEDRDDLLAIDANGRLATVEIGNNQFAYRFPGVLLGALMAVCIYLLTRFLFRRRSVALIASVLVLVDGMFFANSRIAMNDVYVAFFIVAAFTVFVPLWLGRWRRAWQIVIGLVVVGILLGLALSSKWVGLYAIGGVGLLILLRSALGRVIALLAMIAMTGFLGYLAITPNPTVTSPQLNFPFLALMLGLTTLLAVAMTVRPVRMTREEIRLAVLAPLVPGLALLAYGAYRLFLGPPTTIGQTLTPTRLLTYGGVLTALGVAVLVISWLAGRYGHGPLTRADRVDPEREPAAPPPPRGWLRPGSGLLGMPWLLGLGAILVIPLVVYVASYYPWIELGNQWVKGLPAGHTGQLFLDLQNSMYEYHNYLRATHPASSPWWAWPFDLKPVWFEQQDYAGGTTAVIYDTGNLVIFWLAIPAVLWAAWEAWRRRSLPLTFIAIAIASMWLPWARIDRATFQYHIFTTLPFSFMALAYFLAELWHGPSRRTWALARVAAAMAIIGAPLLWLLRLPLCGIARTEQVNKGTEVCANLSRQLELTDLQVIGLLLAIGGLIAAGVFFFTRWWDSMQATSWRPLAVPVSFAVALLGVAVVIIGASSGGRTVFEIDVQAEWPALVALVLLMIPAYFVLRATDPRRYVVGAIGAAVVWFVVFYPNIGSLPVPTALSQIHLGLLPTWNWGFQFGVNMDQANRAPVDMTGVALLAVAAVVLCLAAVYAVRAWRAQRLDEPAVSVLPEAG